MNIMSYIIRTGLKCVGNNLCKSTQYKTQDTSLKFCPNLSIFKEVFPVMKFVVAVGLFTYTSSFILVNVNCQPYRLSRGVKKAFRNRIDYLIERAARYFAVAERGRVEQFTVRLGLSEVERGAALALELSAEVGTVESRPRSQREQGSVGGALRHAARLHGVEQRGRRCLTTYHVYPH